MASTAADIVFPVRYVSEGVAMQTTSRELTALGIRVRSLTPPNVGSRVSMALYLPGASQPEVAIARVAKSQATQPAEAGFWADFLVVDPAARMRIAQVLHGRQSASKSGEHRVFQRFAVRFEVSFRTETEFATEYAGNLSRGGIFIRTDNPPPMNEKVTVELRLPDASTVLSTEGIVVHRVTRAESEAGGGEAGVGVQFVDSTDEFRGWIDSYMDSLREPARG